MMPPNNADDTSDPADDDFRIWDSQCWFPPIELVALAAAGVLPAAATILDVGCGAGIEAIFLAKRGWRVYGIDSDATLVSKAKGFAERHRAPVEFHAVNVMRAPAKLPRDWPRRYGVVLDRFCVNNVVDDKVDERDYYRVIASLVEPGGLYLLRDRANDDAPEATFRRRLFDADDDAKLPEGTEEFFELLPNGRVVDVRLVGDDTPDWNRIDAMVPIRSLLAVLRRK